MRLRCWTFREFAAEAPGEVGIMANLRLAPALPVFPEEFWGTRIVALIICYAGPIKEGQEVLRPLREFKTPAVDAVGPKPYVAHQALFDRATRMAAVLLEGVEAATSSPTPPST